MSNEAEMRAILQELHDKFNQRVYGTSSYIKRDMRDRIAVALAAPVAAQEEAPVAKVVSWTNGSYWRNYKLEWMKDVPEGSLLYLHPPREAGAALGGKPSIVRLAEDFADACVRKGYVSTSDPTHARLMREAGAAAPDEADGARYRAFFDAGLPITFCNVEYDDKASLDAAIDAVLSAPASQGSQP